jgi:hypothetical protein
LAHRKVDIFITNADPETCFRPVFEMIELLFRGGITSTTEKWTYLGFPSLIETHVP